MFSGDVIGTRELETEATIYAVREHPLRMGIPIASVTDEVRGVTGELVLSGATVLQLHLHRNGQELPTEEINLTALAIAWARAMVDDEGLSTAASAFAAATHEERQQ
jgi:hypothetical protein